MYELQDIEVIKKSDLLMLTAGSKSKFRGEWTNILPACELKNRANHTGGCIGKRVRDCKFVKDGQPCRWVRPE